MSTSGDYSTLSSDQVLLRTPRDWIRWIALIRTKARQNDLWDHINPDQEKPSALLEPENPDPDDYNFVEKPVEDKVRYIHALLVYKKANKAWERKTKALQDLETHILKTVGPYYSLIEEQEGVHAALKALQGVLSVPLHQRKDELCQKYEALKKGPRSQNVQSWLQEWELALGTAKSLGMTDLLTNYQPTRAFLKAISSLDPYFSNRYRQDLDSALEKDPQSTSFPDGIEIARKFRRTYASQGKTPLTPYTHSHVNSRKRSRQHLEAVCNLLVALQLLVPSGDQTIVTR